MSDEEHGIDERTLNQWERLDYFYRHNYYRVEKTAKRLQKHGGGLLETKAATPDDDAAMEFIIAMSEFLRGNSNYSVDRYLAYLREIAAGGHDKFLDQVEQQLKTIKKGRINVKVNDVYLTAERAYQVMAERVVFAHDLDANEYLKRVGENPVLLDLLWRLYYDYCLNVWKLLQQVHSYRDEHDLYPPTVERKAHCIYCRETKGEFKHVEHTIPEVLKNELSFLPRGYVCAGCKEKLGRLEDGIERVLPFSMILPFTRLGGKKGKLPKSKFAEVHLERKSPNRIVFKSQMGKPPFKKEEREGGVKLLNLTTQGRIDAHKIARILYKAALGDMALEKGRDEALNPKFDPVRKYITEGGSFPNKLAVSKEWIPSLRIQFRLHECIGTPACECVVLGCHFIVILGDKLTMDQLDFPKPLFLFFDLSKEKPKPEQWEDVYDLPF